MARCVEITRKYKTHRNVTCCISCSGVLLEAWGIHLESPYIIQVTNLRVMTDTI